MPVHSAHLTTPPRLRQSYLVAAVIVAVVTSTYAAWRYANGALPTAQSFQLYDLLIALLVITWLVTDPLLPADKRPSFDHGLLLWMMFPLFALYQLFTTRRWGGVGVLAGFALLFSAPAIALIVVDLVF
jgi:hypothetical protein